MTPHPQADILIAIAHGKTVQMRRKKHAEEWRTPENPLCFLGDSCVDGYEWRVKPETITINGHEVPCPVREPLEKGQVYWCVAPDSDTYTDTFLWGDDDLDKRLLRRGLIHLTKEAAVAHAEALLSFARSDK